MATGLILGRIDRRHHQRRSLRLNMTQCGKTHQIQAYSSFLILWVVAHGRSQLVE